MTGSKRAFASHEYLWFMTLMIMAFVSTQLYMKRAKQGQMANAADVISEQFSPALSNFTYTRTTHSRTQLTTTPEGEHAAVLLDDSFSNRSSFVDDFSDKKMSEEGLFE